MTAATPAASITRNYVPTLFTGHYLTVRHAAILELVAPIAGKLRVADHYKLYEMAFFARGPVLEIGRDEGRSLAILAMGVQDAGFAVPVISIELKSSKRKIAEDNLATVGLLDVVRLVDGDSATRIREFDERYALVFVDGDHSYHGVMRDLAALKHRLEPGSWILFHDYFDERNADPSNVDYGVRQAVDGMACELGLVFRGGCGAIGLFETVSA